MYNIWCEVKKLNILLVFFGIIFSIISFFIDSQYDSIVLIITILLIAYLVKCIFQYLTLKKHGTFIQNLPYELKQINNNEKVLIINYQLPNGDSMQLFKKKYNWGNINDIGTTAILIHIDNPKQYFIFDPVIK